MDAQFRSFTQALVIAMHRIISRLAVAATFVVTAAGIAHAQIRVNPTGVSVNAMAPTTVFLTFGGITSHVPVEAFWCGEIVPATAPDRGNRCDPSTLYGRLPLRNDLSRLNASGTLTDIMSIPASVARRAYQDAQRGARGTFFYVRRFASTTGGPDEYVSVTCRLTGGGANVPFSLTNVNVTFSSDAAVEFVSAGGTVPAISARLSYNGSGRLRGRWEVVMPGEERPTEFDLLTESTLPPEERGRQRRYAQVERFNVLLPPGGAFVLPGPDPTKLPTSADGNHFVLLRIETTDDKAGDSDLGAAGAGTGVIHNGAVAGFSMPTLRYFVGAKSNTGSVAAARALQLLSPALDSVIGRDSVFTLRWIPLEGSFFSRIELQGADGKELLTALQRRGVVDYEVPPLVAERAAGTLVRWRVSALDMEGKVMRQSAWGRFRFP
jgi:hypothetical protein